MYTLAKGCCCCDVLDETSYLDEQDEAYKYRYIWIRYHAAWLEGSSQMWYFVTFLSSCDTISMRFYIIISYGQFVIGLLDSLESASHPIIRVAQAVSDMLFCREHSNTCQNANIRIPLEAASSTPSISWVTMSWQGSTEGQPRIPSESRSFNGCDGAASRSFIIAWVVSDPSRRHLPLLCWFSASDCI